MKDAARLLAFAVATVLFGALLAPPLFWVAQDLTARGHLPFLAQFGFETYFHRAQLLAAVLFMWPLLRSLRATSRHDLLLEPNRRAVRDTFLGFGISAVPLLCFAVVLLALGIYGFRAAGIGAVLPRWTAAVIVPLIEEPLFRGLLLGVLLRACSPVAAMSISSAIYSILHFLKPSDETPTVITWTSGFGSLARSFAQFTDPLLVLAGFTTLFLLGWILADARIRTRSLWLPIGLHAGWIFVSATFNKMAHRELLALPWIGQNLLIGIAPLGVALLSWALLRAWLRHVQPNES